MSDLDTRLREALHDLAPADPATEGLAAGARHYAARVRRARQVGIAGATAAILVVAGVVIGGVLGSSDRPSRVVPAGPLLTPADCTRQAARTSLANAEGESTSGVTAAWVCPDTTAQDTGSAAAARDGWRLPTSGVTGLHTVGLNVVGGADRSSCGSIRPGPAFTLTLATGTGELTTYRSRDLACGGAYALASVVDALAGEEADARAASLPEGELACRSREGWLATLDGTFLTHSLDSPLVAGNFCLVPNFLAGDPSTPIQPIAARTYVTVTLPAEVLAGLNADLVASMGQGFRGNGGCNPEGPWSYAIVGLTAAGDRRMLWTGCLDEFFVAGPEHVGFSPSAETAAALRALVPPS